MNDRDVLDVSERVGRVRAWEASGCAWTCLWACQGVGGFGVRMNMSMGALGHSELIGARDGYRSMKFFRQNKSRTIQLVHPVKH